MSYYKVDYDKVSDIVSEINKEKDDFNKNVSTEIMTGYLKNCPASVAQNMMAMLEASVEEINNGYDSVSTWCSDYANDAMELEQSLANDDIEPYTKELDNISQTINEITPVMGPIVTEEDLNEPYIEEEYVYTDPDEGKEKAALASFATGLLEYAEDLIDGIVIAGSSWRATFGVMTAVDYSVASGEKFDEEKVNEEYKIEKAEGEQEASEFVQRDLTGELYDKTTEGISDSVRYGNVHQVGTMAGTFGGYLVGNALTGPATIVTDYLTSSGDAAELALNSGATIDEAKETGVAAGITGVAVGAVADNVGNLTKGISNQALKTGVDIVGTGLVQASEPVINKVTEYNIYAKDLTTETGEKQYSGFKDYFISEEGLVEVAGAMALGSGASILRKATGKIHNKIKSTGDISNVETSGIAVNKNTTKVDTTNTNSSDVIVRNDNVAKNTDLKNKIQDLTSSAVGTVKTKITNTVSTVNNTINTIGEIISLFDDSISTVVNNAKQLESSFNENGFKQYNSYSDYVKQNQRARSHWKSSLTFDERSLIYNYINTKDPCSYATINSVARDMAIDFENRQLKFYYSGYTTKYSFSEYVSKFGEDIPSFINRTTNEINTLNKAINKSKLSEDTVFYRGLDYDFLLSKGVNFKSSEEEILNALGDVFYDKGFMSATPIETGGFMYKEVQMVLNCKEGTPVADLYDFNPDEEEVLLGIGQKFSVDRVEKVKHNQIRIHMTTID